MGDHYISAIPGEASKLEEFQQKMKQDAESGPRLRALHFTLPFHSGLDTNPCMTAGLFPWPVRPLNKSWPNFQVGRSLISFMVPKPWNGPHLKMGID